MSSERSRFILVSIGFWLCYFYTVFVHHVLPSFSLVLAWLFFGFLYYLDEPDDGKPKQPNFLTKWLNAWYEKNTKHSTPGLSGQQSYVDKSVQDAITAALIANSRSLDKQNTDRM